MASSNAAPLTKMQRAYRNARDRSVPLLAVSTVDPAALTKAIEPVTRNDDDAPAPLVQWDCVRGFEAVNGAGQALARALPRTLNPIEALTKLVPAPESSAVVMLGLNDVWHGPGGEPVRQAVWNLRDVFKKDHRMLVAAGHEITVPASLEHDFLILDEPLPGPADLEAIIRRQFAIAKGRVPNPTDEVVRRAVDAVSGLSAFAAEQAVALSFRAGGLDFDGLRERHRQMIENTRGLSVWRGGETFAQVGGLRAFIGFAERFLRAGVYRPGAVLFVDEIEKALAGIKGDLTGISQDYLASLLTFMQDGNIPGILLMGHPGTGKSLLAKAFGNTAGVPTIRADLGAMHGSLVGQSQHALRHALKVTTAVSQGRPIVIATCNSVAVLPPELVNRFKWRFFVDLPDREEKDVIWRIHTQRRGLTGPVPADVEWNGREIEQCLSPDHEVLGTDLRWRQIREFKVGDTILGFDEKGPCRDYRPAVIEEMAFEPQMCVNVTLESGRIFTVTPDHRFLVSTKGGGDTLEWMRADRLLAGRKDRIVALPRLLPVWREEQTREAGYLAGVMDSEGCYNPNPGLTIGQNPGVVLERIEALLDRFGVEYTRRTTNNDRECQTVRVRGGLAERLNLLGRVRPERLIAKVAFADFGRMEAKLGFDRVVSVTHGGMEEIVKMRTSTGTFVVEGYPHHNCCDNAQQMKCTLLEAAEWVVPVSQSSGEEIERRRREAAGRYLSASHPGPFGYEPKETVQIGERKVRVRDDDATWVAPGSGKAN